MKLIERCSNCLAPTGLYYDAYGDYYCPKHAAQVALWTESKQHLLELIAPAVAAWYQHWKERGLSERELEGTMENLEPFLKDLMDGA